MPKEGISMSTRRLRTIGLISTLVLGLLAAPLPAKAQQTNKVYRIGYLSLRDGFEAREKAFRQGLRELQYTEGQSIKFFLLSGHNRTP